MSPDEVSEEFIAKNEQRRADFGKKCDIILPSLTRSEPSYSNPNEAPGVG